MAETTDDLIERVERGAGEDRRLDADICIALRIHPYGSDHWLKDRVSSFHHDTNCDGWVQPMDRDGVTPLPGGSWKTGAYTTSLDAVLALIARMLTAKTSGGCRCRAGMRASTRCTAGSAATDQKTSPAAL